MTAVQGRPYQMTGIDLLKNNPLYQIQISIPNRKIKGKSLFNTIIGFVVDNFSIGGESRYTDLFEPSSDQQALMKAMQATQFGAQTGVSTVSDIFKAFGWNPSVGMYFQHISQTTSFYNGTEKPRFDLNMLLIATNCDTDPRIEASMLYDTVYPTEGNGGLLVPPLGYSPGFNRVDGTVSIRIGKWFKAHNQIITSVQTEYSKQVSRYGFPVYCRVRLSFTPWRLPTADEIKSYLVNVQTYNPDTSPEVPITNSITT